MGRRKRTFTPDEIATTEEIMGVALEIFTAADPPKNPPRSYETSPINRIRRTKAQIRDIQHAIYAVCEADHPQTVRGVFYRLEVAGLVPKDMTGYSVVQRECLKMRRQGALPYGWITDGTRLQRKPTSYDDLGDFYFRSAQLYRRNLWADARVSVEIWCEKDALAGVLLEETALWDVPLMVARGFSSESFLHATAEEIKDAGKPTYIYHFGDHDPSGVLIDGQIERGLRRLAPDAEIHFHRCAVTREQIAAWDLPTRPTKRKDNTHATNFEGHSVELDAIPAHRLRALVRDAISQHVDVHALDVVQTAEASEMALLRRMANRELGKIYDDADVTSLVGILDKRQDAMRQRWQTIANGEAAR